MKTVLTIAGFDPSSGAGVTADLMVFAAHRLFGTSAITALTVQSTLGVRATHPVDAYLLRDTLDCLNSDIPPAGIKIGMLATAANVAVVCDAIAALRKSQGPAGPIPVVLDPVIRSSSGRELLDPAGLALLRERLLPLVDWITPNLDELAVLSGLPIRQHDDLPVAARTLQKVTSSMNTSTKIGVLATGGHLDPPDDLILSPAGDTTWLPGHRLRTRATHGTGCTFSSAFLSNLVLGADPADAARDAKAYVSEAMTLADIYGSGRCGLKHLWPLLHPIHDQEHPDS